MVVVGAQEVGHVLRDLAHDGLFPVHHMAVVRRVFGNEEVVGHGLGVQHVAGTAGASGGDGHVLGAFEEALHDEATCTLSKGVFR